MPKPNGKFQPVINLKYLNEFIQYDHFKQETFSTVLDLLQKGDYMTSIDLQDAYIAVPVQKDSQKYLKFSWNGVLYKFVCVCFGIKSAPFLFTKLLNQYNAMFREQKIRCFYYIDDSLNMDTYKSRIISADPKKSLKYWGLNNLTCMISFKVLLYAYPAKTVM